MKQFVHYNKIICTYVYSIISQKILKVSKCFMNSQNLKQDWFSTHKTGEIGI